MDIVAARGLTALFHPAAEHAELQRRGADVHRQDVPAHTRPSFSSSDRSASTCAAVSGASGLRGMPPLYPARVMAAFTPGGPYGPAIAWLIRVTRSCKGAPFRSSRACPHRNSSRASSGNELARDTAPPTEPPIMAANRKLADPARPGKLSDWNGRKCAIPLAALSFIPAMFG